jgi:hypothetical protein
MGVNQANKKTRDKCLKSKLGHVVLESELRVQILERRGVVFILLLAGEEAGH